MAHGCADGAATAALPGHLLLRDQACILDQHQEELVEKAKVGLVPCPRTPPLLDEYRLAPVNVSLPKIVSPKMHFHILLVICIEDLVYQQDHGGE